VSGYLPDLTDVLLKPWEYRNDMYKLGFWRAKVLDVNDPEGRGRVKVRILLLHPETSTPSPGASLPTTIGDIPDDNCPWAEPGGFLGAGGHNSGVFSAPPVGATVWVAFEMGHSGRPVWFGGWMGAPNGVPDLPTEFLASPSNVRLLRTPAGHSFILNDTTALESITLQTKGGHKVLLDDTLSSPHIEVTSKLGHTVKINDQTSTITAQLSGGLQSVTLTQSAITVQSGVVTLTLSSTGEVAITTAGNVTVTTPGMISLGGPLAIHGIAFDTIVAKFNSHYHMVGSSSSSPPLPATSLLVNGVDTTLTVKSKV
jgi:hypothetical protein